MSSLVQEARQQVGSRITTARWALGLSGALSVVFGAVIAHQRGFRHPS